MSKKIQAHRILISFGALLIGLEMMNLDFSHFFSERNKHPLIVILCGLSLLIQAIYLKGKIKF